MNAAAVRQRLQQHTHTHTHSETTTAAMPPPSKKGARKPRWQPRPEDPHPLESAGWLSHVTWSWLYKLMSKGLEQPLTDGDVWDLPQCHRAENLRKRFDELKVSPSQAPLFWVLRTMFWRRWAVAGLMYIGWCISAGLQPFLVAAFVGKLQEDAAPLEELLCLCAALFVATLGYNLFINHKFHQLVRNGLDVRQLLISLIYEKALRLSLGAGSVGSTVNLMSNDAERVFEASMFLHYLWACPAYVVVIVTLVSARIGPAALVGFGLLILVIPFQAVLGRWVGHTKRRMMPAGDRRTELMSQLLGGIHVIKSYCWEGVFGSKMEAERLVETKELRTFQLLRAVMRAVLYFMPSLVPYITLITYVALGNELTLEVTFLTFSFISILRFPLLLIPHAFSLLFEAKVSLGRIEAYLRLPEAPRCRLEPAAGQRGRPVEVACAQVTRGAGGAAALRDVRVTLGHGIHIARGSVGSGKTTLVLAILAELEGIGKKWRVGLAEQTPFIRTKARARATPVPLFCFAATPRHATRARVPACPRAPGLASACARHVLRFMAVETQL